jgi:hypothetical protein
MTLISRLSGDCWIATGDKGVGVTATVFVHAASHVFNVLYRVLDDSVFEERNGGRAAVGQADHRISAVLALSQLPKRSDIVGLAQCAIDALRRWPGFHSIAISINGDL